MTVYIFILYFTIDNCRCNILQHYETLHVAHICFTNVLCMIFTIDRHILNSTGWRVDIMYKNCVNKC